MIRIAGFYLMRKKEFAGMVNYRVRQTLEEFMRATLSSDIDGKMSLNGAQTWIEVTERINRLSGKIRKIVGPRRNTVDLGVGRRKLIKSVERYQKK